MKSEAYAGGFAALLLPPIRWRETSSDNAGQTHSREFLCRAGCDGRQRLRDEWNDILRSRTSSAFTVMTGFCDGWFRVALSISTLSHSGARFDNRLRTWSFKTAATFLACSMVTPPRSS